MTKSWSRSWRSAAGFLRKLWRSRGSITPPAFSTTSPPAAIPDQINAYQTELIRELAEKESCVIVGRCADSVLRDREDCFHVFIFGALRDRTNRVVAEHGIDAKAAEGHVKNRDKKRAAYYKHITDKVWGMSSNYDLCLNSSKLGIDRCVELILAATGAGTNS